jgi:hypothetical protein
MEAAGGQAEQVYTGYPSRYLVSGLAVAYDWIYDQLSASDRTALCSLLDSYWTVLNTPVSGGYEWVAFIQSYGNYLGGHIYGFGLAGIAFEGDDANALTIQNGVLAKLQTYVIPAIETGLWQNGFQVEGYNYGPANMVRLFLYFYAMHTAGKDSLLTDANGPFNYIPFFKAAARSTVYALRPPVWRVMDEGDFPDTYSGLAPVGFYGYMALCLGNAQEGQWMQYLAANPGAPPGGWPSGTNPSPLDAFMTAGTGVVPANPWSTLPLAAISAGDYHTFVRTDWTTSATQTTFNAGVPVVTDHQGATDGHVSIFRQNDYLLVASGQYNGYYGWAGSPGPEDKASWKANTMFVSDPSLDKYGSTICRTDEEQFIGCVSLYNSAIVEPVAHLETANYAYSKANFTNAYGNSRPSTPFTSYYRTFLNIGGVVSFVFDRATAVHLSATRKLFWHVPSYGVTTTLNGNVASNTVGSSTLWIATLLPATPTLAWVQDTTTWGGTTTQYTQRLEVSDPNAGTNPTTLFLTVLAPVASTTTQAAYSLIDAVTMKGAIYDDGVAPRVALFSTDGTAQAAVSYVASCTPGVQTRHVVLDLKPGVYTVRKDGQVLYASVIAQTDGSATFTSLGGGTFALSATGVPPPGMTGRTVLVGNASF